MKKLWKNIGIKTSLITIIINLLLFIIKLVLGIVGHSKALVSDAIHSLSDVFTTIIVIFGFIIASKDADDNHPYGHERVESAFAVVLSFILFLTSSSITSLLAFSCSLILVTISSGISTANPLL